MTNVTIPPPPENAPAVHTFDSTVEAYDNSQCDEKILNGDVLWVPSENAAAILHLAWPTALPGYQRGEFHTVDHPDFKPWFDRGLEALRKHL